MFIPGHVTLGNDLCNLCHNGARKLQGKLQEKMSSVTAPLMWSVAVSCDQILQNSAFWKKANGSTLNVQNPQCILKLGKFGAFFLLST